MSAFSLHIENGELGAFLGGVLVAVMKTRVDQTHANLTRDLGRQPSDEQWQRARESACRDAFLSVVECFPEPIRVRLAQQEADLIAATLQLN